MHPIFNVKEYKVEVWRERDAKVTKMDVGFVNIASAVKGELIYYYNTWQEWGNYYFTISFIHDICNEDDENVCSKTVTPKISLGMYGKTCII